MASAQENKNFTDHIMAGWPLDQAIDWISSNMAPEDVFDEKILEEWAENNGYVKEAT